MAVPVPLDTRNEGSPIPAPHTVAELPLCDIEQPWFGLLDFPTSAMP